MFVLKIYHIVPFEIIFLKNIIHKQFNASYKL